MRILDFHSHSLKVPFYSFIKKIDMVERMQQ